jgi:acyl-CoA reductase-like NAD-dependent aldehyde dehydrogenase
MPGRNARQIVVRNPADRRRVVETAPVATREHVAEAVKSAEDGLESCSAVPITHRRKALLAIAVAIENKREGLAALLTSEVGKPLAEARSEVSATAATFRHYAGLKYDEQVVVRDDQIQRAHFERGPVGVCALVLPWNYPLLLAAWKMAPALLAGNSVVLKPSEYAPLTVSTAVGLVRTRLPKGAVGLVAGGDEVGRWLVEDRRVSRVAFTGSAETGERILQEASNRPARVTLELGGNDAALVLPDIDLRRRSEQLFWGAFRNCGQVCIAIKRLYVHENVHDKVVRALAHRASKLKIGPGMEPGVELGPVNNEAQLVKVQGLVEEALDDGGVLATGGRRLRGRLRHGLFYEPAVVTGLGNDSSLVQEEQFGPALPIIAFSDVDEAVEMANESKFALGASVWSEDARNAMGVARQLDAGIVWVNGHATPEMGAPFGGRKGSGVGRELGLQGLLEYLDTKTYIVRY